MKRALLGAWVLWVGCASRNAPVEDPATPAATPKVEEAAPTPGEAGPSADPTAPPARPAGKRPPCDTDQSCNEDAAASALWGKCTSLGVCECQAGFELNPKGRCQATQ